MSDVRFSRSAAPARQQARRRGCDLYLACDLLVAADPKNLAVTAPDRTVAVVSTAEVPTGPMVSDPAWPSPTATAVSQPILDRGRATAPSCSTARRSSSGCSATTRSPTSSWSARRFQAGALPLPPDAIEEAIGLNGVAVEKNLQAFRRGRQCVADPRARSCAAAGLGQARRAPTPGGPRLDRLIRTARPTT